MTLRRPTLRALAVLIVATMLSACGVCKAADRDGGPAGSVSSQTNSNSDAAVNLSESDAVTNAAADDVESAQTDNYPDGHLPANWNHMPGDRVLIESEGLSISQPGLHPSRYIDFGLPRDVVVRAVSIMRGRATGSGRTARCAHGPMDFTAFGPLILNFRHGRFVGWILNPGSRPVIEADLGLTTGIPREWVGYGDDDVRIISRSRRRVQFEVGGIGGFLAGNRPHARVTRLYAGATCFARTPT